MLLFVVPGVAINLRHGIFKSRKEKLRDETRRGSEENVFPEPDTGLEGTFENLCIPA